MDLSDFSLRDNSERYDELFAIGYDSTLSQLSKVSWYHKTNILLYLWRIVRELAPFKIPALVRRLGPKDPM